MGFCTAYSAQGEDRPGLESAVAPKIDPLANRILKESGNYLKEIKEFSFHAEITYDAVVPPNGKVQYGASADVAVKRPDKLYFEFASDIAARRFWYDGKEITVLDTKQDVYGTISTVATIDQALDKLMLDYGWSIPLSEIAYNDPYQTLIKGVKEGYYIGLHKVDGVRCHHLIFIEDRIDWQVWIEDGTELVPRKVTITYKTLPSSPQYTAVLSEWNLAARLPDMIFSALLPKGAEKIEFIQAIRKKSPPQ